MGITCKPVGKFQSIMKKMENQLEAERKGCKREEGDEEVKEVDYECLDHR